MRVVAELVCSLHRARGIDAGSFADTLVTLAISYVFSTSARARAALAQKTHS